MADEITSVYKKTNRLYISNVTTVFSILLLIVICRLEFPGKCIFITMYIITIVAYTVIIYNTKMPQCLRFSPNPPDLLSPTSACADSVVHVPTHDQHQIPLERRLMLHDF